MEFPATLKIDDWLVIPLASSRNCLLIFFCFIPMKISQSFLGSKDGSKFWWLPWFLAQNNSCVNICNTVYLMYLLFFNCSKLNYYWSKPRCFSALSIKKIKINITLYLIFNIQHSNFIIIQISPWHDYWLGYWTWSFAF